MSETTEAEVSTSAVTKVARNLTAIIALAGSLEDQAVNKANDRLMPGGLAMVALAAVASPSEWAEQVEAAEHRHLTEPRRWAPIALDDDEDWEPPLQTLRFWSETWRTVHGMSYGNTITLASEANFIRWALNWAWDNESHWDDFAADVHRTRSRLEALLYAGSRQERTRVICDRDYCETRPRLIKVHAERRPDSLVCPQCEATYATDEATHCRACDTPLEVVWFSDPADDCHKCPSCKTRFDAGAFDRAHKKQLRSESAEKFVGIADAIGTLKALGRPERTIRKWLEPPVHHTADHCDECGNDWEPNEHAACPGETEDGEPCGGILTALFAGDREGIVGGYCEVGTHNVLVWWPDIWRLHLTTRTRRRAVA